MMLSILVLDPGLHPSHFKPWCFPFLFVTQAYTRLTLYHDAFHSCSWFRPTPVSLYTMMLSILVRDPGLHPSHFIPWCFPFLFVTQAYARLTSIVTHCNMVMSAFHSEKYMSEADAVLAHEDAKEAAAEKAATESGGERCVCVLCWCLWFSTNKCLCLHKAKEKSRAVLKVCVCAHHATPPLWMSLPFVDGDDNP